MPQSTTVEQRLGGAWKLLLGNLSQWHPRASSASRKERAGQGGLRPLRVLFVQDHLGQTMGLVHGVTRYLVSTLPAFDRCSRRAFPVRADPPSSDRRTDARGRRHRADLSRAREMGSAGRARPDPRDPRARRRRGPCQRPQGGDARADRGGCGRARDGRPHPRRQADAGLGAPDPAPARASHRRGGGGLAGHAPGGDRGLRRAARADPRALQRRAVGGLCARRRRRRAAHS